MSERDRRSVALAAGLGLALMLAVIVAAAGIRLETGIPGLRIVHRVTASLEVLVVLWLGWMAWRRRAVQLAIALTALLSVVGIVGGQSPPREIAAINLAGGLALAAVFAWMLGKSGSEPDFRCISATAMGNRALTPIFLLLAVQLGLGAWLSIVERYSVALPIHGLLAVALTAALIWIARARAVFLALALAAPIAGFTALHFEYSAAAALAHVAAAALLLASTAHALGRAA
ncbi:MAG TPA: hypothetical protein VHI32_04890 [Burkholderiales bacterium]|jgi:hypothetical protein|nr:hypothetical protein [Burkholderiales bacterium]